MRKQLTEAMITKEAPPKSGRREIFDSIVPAMALRITSAGAKSFIVRCRVKGEPQPRRFTIGDADTIKLAVARDEASDILKACRAGNDPSQERKKKAQEAARERRHLFRAVADSFLADHVAGLRDRKKMEAEIRRLLLGQVWKPWSKEQIAKARADGDKRTGEWTDQRNNPCWRERPIGSITDDDIAERIREIQKAHGPHVARRMLAYTKKLFAWASAPGRPGRLKLNPCSALSAKKHFGMELARRQVALSDNHVRLICAAIPTLPEPFGAFFKMLLLTGQRRGEVAGAKWSELDLDRDKIWILPAERMKAKRPHVVPLTKEMIALLEELQEKRGSGDFVFSTMLGERPISGFSKSKSALDKKVAELYANEAGQTAPPLPGWRIHDLRRTVRTGLGALPSVPHDIRELIIAHVPPSLVQTYDLHAYRDEKRQALELWAQRLMVIVEAPSPHAEPERSAAE